MRTETAKQDALKRLAYIEGHLRGIRKMVEDDQYCVDGRRSRPTRCKKHSKSSRVLC